MAEAKPEAAAGPQLLLQKVFLKDASVEVPKAPEIFTRSWKPQVDVQLNIDVKPLGEEQWQVLLAVTVTARTADEVAYLIEVKQAGLFLMRGFASEAETAAVLGSYCPAQIFPFVRETVADLVQRAGFPQFLLQPVNFDALYHEHQARARAQATGAEHGGESRIITH